MTILGLAKSFKMMNRPGPARQERSLTAYFLEGRNMVAVTISVHLGNIQRTVQAGWKKLHQLSERLTPFDIMGTQLTAPLKPLSLIVLLCSRGFRGAHNWAPRC